MTVPIPFPEASDPPVHETAQTTLAPSTKGTVTMSPETSGNEHRIPIVAISKATQTSYRVRVDGNDRFGPSPIPPTDVDDLQVTFLPSLALGNELEVEIKDLRSNGGSRTYAIQVIGWEAEGAQNGA